MEWYEDKIFQLMCEKAIEIQDLWEVRNGDFYKQKLPSDQICNVNLFDNDDEEEIKFTRACNIWLPTQAQLQGIIPGLPLNHLLRINKFIYNQDNGSGQILNYTSMEQLWLAFVMWELYQKKWDSKRKEWMP